MIYQELSLAPHMSVMDNIALGMSPVAKASGLARRRSTRGRSSVCARCAATARARRNRCDGRASASLSPAAQQLVEMARALATGCRVLVLDEPTSSLAHRDVAQLFDLIARLKQQGLAIVYISHFIEEVTQVSDRFVVLRDGRNAGEGRHVARLPRVRSSSLMVGRTLEDIYPRGARAIGDAGAGDQGLAPERLEPASITLHRGEILGIAGLLGAGPYAFPSARCSVWTPSGAGSEAGRLADRRRRRTGGARHGDAQRKPHRRRARGRSSASPTT